MKSIIVIAHDIRSCHNIGSLLRTAEGLGIDEVILTGYTPYPLLPHDDRLPHLAAKLHKQIQKTALGAETTQKWSHQEDVGQVIKELKIAGYTIAALEQSKSSVLLPTYHAPEKVALLLGREVEGIDQALLQVADVHLEIPMYGSKESFNVVQAAAMALYQLKFM